MLTSWPADVRRRYKTHLCLLTLLCSVTSGRLHLKSTVLLQNPSWCVSSFTHIRDSTRKDTWILSQWRLYLVKHRAPVEIYNKEYNVFLPLCDTRGLRLSSKEKSDQFVGMTQQIKQARFMPTSIYPENTRIQNLQNTFSSLDAVLRAKEARFAEVSWLSI